MLEADLQQLRDDNSAIATLLQELENSLALPLPPEPPFQVMADVTALQDQVYAMARRIGSMKRVIRDRILQQALEADSAPHGEEMSETARPGLCTPLRPWMSAMDIRAALLILLIFCLAPGLMVNSPLRTTSTDCMAMRLCRRFAPSWLAGTGSVG